MVDERRSYFRVDDMAWVLTAQWNPDQASAVEYFPELRQTTILHALDAVDVELKKLDKAMDSKPTAMYARTLNQKIDIFRQALLIQQLSQLDSRPIRITISEGGLGFMSDFAYTVGSHIAMALVFSPSYMAIFPQAEILECRPVDNGFYLHVAFVDMPESMRQQLARHLLVQQTLLRQQHK
ncbi:PilZ domain-containing protein [Salinispirillum marinum]|uniref:PilZ domain-containing protein n=2 Tax=Saccharospirillaceae TaxID=255527 RepID=A0ABV8BG41_9GAMM